MARSFPVSGSASVNINEIDLTGIVPAVSSTEGALAAVFKWGPFQERVLVDSEDSLYARFGAPTNFNAESWFTASSFLAYGNRLYIVRAGDVSGNTVERVFAGNSTNFAIAGSNNYLQLQNTTNLAVGMQLFYSNSTAISLNSNVYITAVVNATTVTLSDSATANVENIDVIFREDTVFSAVCQETYVPTIDWDNQTVLNEDEYLVMDGNFDASVQYVARYAGSRGNSLRISQCDSANQFHSNTILASNVTLINATATSIVGVVSANTLTVTVAPVDTANATMVTSAQTVATSVLSSLSVGDLLEIGNTSISFQYPKVTALPTALTNTSNVFSFVINISDHVSLKSNTNNTYLSRYWEFYNEVDQAPGLSTWVLNNGNTAAVDEVHVVIVDEEGEFTTNAGTILEVYKNVSRAIDAKAIDGGSNYYKNVINQRSQYVWWAGDRSTATSANAQFITSSSATAPMNVNMYGGADGPDESTISLGNLLRGYDYFISAEDVDISLVLQGKARGEGVSSNTTLANYLIDNIAEARKDCVVFVSPDKEHVVDNKFREATDLVTWRNNLRSTSYAVADSSYKKIYDKYNDIMRWVPLNGDIAGLCVRTDDTNAPWWSPAGFNRGQIKNIVSLSYNPRKTDRDTLYRNNINPVVTFPGQGTVLFGDKTLLTKPSAFDRINVRRLFIVLEKAIATAAKYLLFEFNDDFTRAQFKSMVNPYLKDVQGQRGIYDFLVVCDAINNTPEVIDRNQFVGDIYIKPARSINFITLNFIAVRTGVAFSEVVGKF